VEASGGALLCSLTLFASGALGALRLLLLLLLLQVGIASARVPKAYKPTTAVAKPIVPSVYRTLFPVLLIASLALL